MILKNCKVEQKDDKTGLVLKRIITSEWEHLNRKIAVNNSLFACEKRRLIYEKPILNSPFQIHHIFFNNKKNVWNFDRIAESKAHASKHARFYLAFQQRNASQWENLTFQEAEVDFQELSTRGLSLVPYPIPLNATLEEWKKRKTDALSVLNKSQVLVAIFCSKHQIELFDEIFNYEFENSSLIGIQCYGLKDATSLLNLMKIRLRNSRLQTGDESPILIGLNYEKILRKLSYVSGSFAYSCFGFDILSCRQLCMENMPINAIKEMLNRKVEEILRYDKTLGGFNQSAEQIFWNGTNLTREFLENVVIAEGLSPYQAIQWSNHYEQQNDFDVLNKHILATADKDKEDVALKYIENEKEKWSVFWKMQIPQII